MAASPKKRVKLNKSAEEQPTLKIESVEVSSLVEDPANARKHSDKNLKAIKGSLARFGQQKPIVVGKNNVVIAGNGTLRAAEELGWERINIVRTKLTSVDAAAFALADNRTSELATWDDQILASVLESLAEENRDLLGDIGFTDADIDLALSKANYDGEPNSIDDEYTDMPFDSSESEPVFQKVLITVRDEENARKLAKLLGRPLSSAKHVAFSFPPDTRIGKNEYVSK